LNPSGVDGILIVRCVPLVTKQTNEEVVIHKLSSIHLHSSFSM